MSNSKAYKTMGLAPGDSMSDLERAYKKLAIKYHPDKNRDNQDWAHKKFIELGQSRDILKKTIKAGTQESALPQPSTPNTTRTRQTDADPASRSSSYHSRTGCKPRPRRPSPPPEFRKQPEGKARVSDDPRSIKHLLKVLERLCGNAEPKMGSILRTLSTQFPTDRGTHLALDDLDVAIARATGRVYGLLQHVHVMMERYSSVDLTVVVRKLNSVHNDMRQLDDELSGFYFFCCCGMREMEIRCYITKIKAIAEAVRPSNPVEHMPCRSVSNQETAL